MTGVIRIGNGARTVMTTCPVVLAPTGVWGRITLDYAAKTPPSLALTTITNLTLIDATSQEPPENDENAWEELQKTALSVEELLEVREHLRITGQASA
jgi:hypothetical protein